jgi:hypothetical protein
MKIESLMDFFSLHIDMPFSAKNERKAEGRSEVAVF